MTVEKPVKISGEKLHAASEVVIRNLLSADLTLDEAAKVLAYSLVTVVMVIADHTGHDAEQGLRAMYDDMVSAVDIFRSSEQRWKM